MSRIPADQTAGFNPWNLPEVKEGQVISAEKLRRRGSRGELIDVDKNAVIYNNITAAQLEEISNQAYEDIRQQAHKQGLKEGYDEGYQAGIKAGQNLIQQQADGLGKAIDATFQHLAGQDDDVEQGLVNLATCLASSVLRRELSIDASHLLALVREAIATLPLNASDITVHLSEQDHQLLGAHVDLSQWQLHIDRNLSPGGCLVSTRHSLVDYTLEEQFQQTVTELVETRFSELAADARQHNNNHHGND